MGGGGRRCGPAGPAAARAPAALLADGTRPRTGVCDFARGDGYTCPPRTAAAAPFRSSRARWRVLCG